MPTYQYACTECGHAFEQFQSFSDDALTVCPQCEGRLRKVFNAVGVVFKGSGSTATTAAADAKNGASASSNGGEKSADKTGSTSSETSGSTSGEKSRRRRQGGRVSGGSKESGPRAAPAARRAPPAPPERTCGRPAARRREVPSLGHDPSTRLPLRRRRLRRAVLARRRPIAALCAAVAVAASLQATRRPLPRARRC